MQLVLVGFVLALSLISESTSVPTEKSLVDGEPLNDSAALPHERSKTPEKEDVPSMPELREMLAMVPPEDNPEHPQPQQHLSVRPRSNFQPWLHGGPEEPVCRVKLDGSSTWGPNHLEVVGLLNSYDEQFLKALSRAAWSKEEMELFGLCPTDFPHGHLSFLQHVGHYLASPGDNHFLLLHLEEVKWEAETKLRFKLTVQEDVESSLGLPQFAMLVFYQGRKESAVSSPRQMLLMSGEGLYRQQVVCLSRSTQYIVLWGALLFGRHTPGQLSFELSLEIRRQSSTGPVLSAQEAQDLLFGFDAKCFTRMTPAVLLMVKRRPGGPTVSPSSFLTANGKLDTAPYLPPRWPETVSLPTSDMTDVPSLGTTSPSQANVSEPVPRSTTQFVEMLSQFVNQVLKPASQPGPTPRVHLQLDVATMEALPHMLLNLSEKVAFEQLVQSEDHLLVLFPENNQALVGDQLGIWNLDEKQLQQLLGKLHSVIQELSAMPSFRSNADLFHALLGFCYYPSAVPGGFSSSIYGGAEGSTTQGKIHSLLLLKGLQAVLAHWRESRAPSRVSRSAQSRGEYCQLQEQRVNLASTGYVILPESYNANNCVGSCQFPLSTRIPNYFSHTIFLLHMHEQGMPLQRVPCCVPEKYSQSYMATFSQDQGMIVKVYPNMVAESCGCR
uniref:Muellerian-inhibiting factor n=1 Tax=Varanus komodoensis TaxID=61221 RepID=A0A8D2LCX4_VARKO